MLGIKEGLAQLTQRASCSVTSCMFKCESELTTDHHFSLFPSCMSVLSACVYSSHNLYSSLALFAVFCRPLQFLFKLCLIGFSSRDCTMFPLFSCAECWINPSREVLIHITCSFSSHWLLIVHFAGASVGLFVCVISTLFILCDNTVTIQLRRQLARLL